MVASIFYALLLSFFRSNNNAKILFILESTKKCFLFLVSILYVIKHVLCKILINILL